MKKKLMIVVLLAVTMITTSCVQKMGKTIAQNIMSGAEIPESTEQETGDEERLKDQLYEEIASETYEDERLVAEQDNGDTVNLPEESSLSVNPVMNEGEEQPSEDLKDSNKPDSENDFKTLNHTEDAYAAYEVILDEYRAACAVDSMSYFADIETYEAMYPNVNPFELFEYHVPYHHRSLNDLDYEKHELMYAYYDINQNGIPELLIFESSWQLDICDIYAFDGTSAVKLFPDNILLDNIDCEFVVIYDDATLCLMTGDSIPYRWNADGYTLEEIPWEEWDWDRDQIASFDMELLAQDIPSDEAEWKKSYLEYIKANEDSNPNKYPVVPYMYALIYVDDDDIPELYINGLGEAEGDRICTIGNHNLVEDCVLRRTYGASYIERSGMICNFNGNMDYYPLEFYRLENGAFTLLENVYGSEEVTWSDNGEPTDRFFWNDVEVSESEFYDNWNNIMKLDDLKRPSDNRYDATVIMAMIQSI